jgi:hypothetical protein
VVEIKERAIQQAQRASRGASAISLIRSAKGQIWLARACENAGDLKGAPIAFTKAASLSQVFTDAEGGECAGKVKSAVEGAHRPPAGMWHPIQQRFLLSQLFPLARGWGPYAVRAYCRK